MGPQVTSGAGFGPASAPTYPRARRDPEFRLIWGKNLSSNHLFGVIASSLLSGVYCMTSMQMSGNYIINSDGNNLLLIASKPGWHV